MQNLSYFLVINYPTLRKTESLKWKVYFKSSDPTMNYLKSWLCLKN